METILILLIGTGGVVGLIGGTMSIISYFSPSARSIRNSDKNIKEIQSFKGTIELLLEAKERAEQSEKKMSLEIQELRLSVAILLGKYGISQTIIKKYKLVTDYVKSCVHNKDNTDNCPVAIKLRELDLENKQND